MTSEKKKIAIIVGAGPAGLTAAYELLTRTNIKPIILEQSEAMGGLSRTEKYKGNRIDIGGHRFFSKSDRVMQWWLQILPLDPKASGVLPLHYQRQQKVFETDLFPKAALEDEKVMLVRQRKSRIYFLKKFFPYPLNLSLRTLQKLGFVRTLRIMVSYLYARVFFNKKVVTLEDIFIDRFGGELYRTFFKSYTEKVWGVPCSELSASWGAQRIKDLSIREAIRHMLREITNSKKKKTLEQKDVSTSLIEQFLYPNYGPGQLWEEVARLVVEKGGEIIKGVEITGMQARDFSIVSLKGSDKATGLEKTYTGDYYFSTMPLQTLIGGMEGIQVPEKVREVAEGLVYRDFITIGLLVTGFSPNALKQGELKDNWIYIQDDSVQIGRLQIFNNWSPAMVADKNKTWLGLEYFCQKGDPLWQMTDEALMALGHKELQTIGLVEANALLDGTVIRQEKTYPSYTGSFEQFGILRQYLEKFDNLYPMGRNGMHRYNNSDHSMLTAMVSVDLIQAGTLDKHSVWEINTEESYHESKGENSTKGDI